MKKILFNLTPDELTEFVAGMGQPKFRAKQITEWLDRGAPDFSVMKNLPEQLREQLAGVAETLPLTIADRLDSADGETTKFLLRLADGELIESVLMRTNYGNSVCVSSQVGCAMGCRFCASTLLGLRRNLTTAEMAAQVLIAQWTLRAGRFDIAANGDRNNGDVSHVVIMGTGEPLQNTENSIAFMEFLHEKLNISWRKITISTCGLVPGIEQLTQWGRPVNLAISLHAPTDELRRKIMPIADRHTIVQVLDAAFANAGAHNRQLMIEYILLGGFNDSVAQADELADLLRGREVMVNLIPWNAVGERDWTAPSGNAIHRFNDALIKKGINSRIRRERGADIASACGQLRAQRIS
ncbi:MAG: 23S rRNA (adenine(2503)-C(2))-methyltransferase RlmN [Rickettsiales bacterium]|jgi:23S rRNA (adenine2503-C2)-methyltransferase|nr:23S rRNA (adenine(2503)-C(2))-methyltransferase RlmN [Rickettsiales bacterium]